ncbi:DUF4194 domain-containing protein [Luethyella okanaganae]|uniref:DUF4194 domain-containing protein n=1 Tax=Luethyella okanaganae TaxID=69372 RepID=A0ABW1VFP0_9MICO
MSDNDTRDRALWDGDRGELSEISRRALLELVKGPYLSALKSAQLWSALLADESAITSRLHELFLELVVDRIAGFAFVRNADTGELDAPATVRTHNLTYLDTVMLLALRQMLLAGDSGERVIVGRDDVFDQLRVYRTSDRDEHEFDRRLNASWVKMRNVLRVVHSAGRMDEEDRVEISPVLRLIVDADQVNAIAKVYQHIIDTGSEIVDAVEDDEDTSEDGTGVA